MLDHDGMGQQHHGGQGMPSSRRDSSPELVMEQQQGKSGVSSRRRNSSPEPTNKISLAFSNYALVEISRTGIGKNRKYEFEYWGPTTYGTRSEEIPNRGQQLHTHSASLLLEI